MSDDYDWDYGSEIIKKSLTTSHLEMPSFDPTPASPSPDPEPLPPADNE